MPLSRRHFAKVALAGAAGSFATRLAALPARPKLFVFLIADQFRPGYLDRNEAWLEKDGFRYLMNNGVYYPNCHFAASTFTAGGLATLVTGAYPQLHGIVADQWYDRRGGGAVVKARNDRLEATTLADEAAHTGHCRIFCCGIDEAPALLLAGAAPARSFFMDASGQFVTRGDIPGWLAEHNRMNPIESMHGAHWLAVGAAPDMTALRTLTFDEHHAEEFLALYKSSRFGQDAQFELLRELIEKEQLGQGDTLDFLFVSLGSIGLLGYEVGADSMLMDEMVRRLDRQIEATLVSLNKTMAGKYNLVFTAAHGAPPAPDPTFRSSKVIAGQSLARAINKGISDALDDGAAKHVYVDKYVYPFLYLKTEAFRKTVGLNSARKLAGEIALRQPGVAGYYTADGDCSHSEDWRRRFANSFHTVRSGDVMLSYEPGMVEDFGAGRGVSYGSLYSYDTRVPLFLFGPQFAPQTIERSIEPVDLAPTIARAAGIGFPSSVTGAVLDEAFAADEKRGK